MKNFDNTISEEKAFAKQKAFRYAAFAVGLLLVVTIIYFLYMSMGGVSLGAGFDADKKADENLSTAAPNPVNAAVNNAIPKDKVLKDKTLKEGDLKEREKFKQALSEYEAVIQTLLQNSALMDWAKDGVANAQRSKRAALEHFAEGSYRKAVQLLAGGALATNKLIESWHAAFEGKYFEAEKTLNEGQLNRARLALSQAKKIKPTEPRVAILEAKIEVFPQLASLYKQLDIAKVENDIGKQARLLKEITTLDSSEKEAAKDLKKAQRQGLNMVFKKHVDEGLRQLEKGNVDSAERAYRRAKQMYPHRSELRVLAQKLNHVTQESSLSAVYVELEALAAQDDWRGVQQLTLSAEASFSGDRRIADYKDLAGAIVPLRRDAAGYVQRSERLADSNIQGHAKALIRDALPYLAKSPGLARDVRTIGHHIDRYSKEYPVTVFSDNKTHIVVKGVGTVEQTAEKIIHLAEGRYIIEASRRGYRTKQLALIVSSHQKNQISVVCDERI